MIRFQRAPRPRPPEAAVVCGGCQSENEGGRPGVAEKSDCAELGAGVGLVQEAGHVSGLQRS